jgi:hypothetical protein
MAQRRGLGAKHWSECFSAAPTHTLASRQSLFHPQADSRSAQGGTMMMIQTSGRIARIAW